MFDHVGVVVSDLKRSADFYREILAPLGFRILEKHPRPGGEGWVVIGTGEPHSSFFVVAAGRPTFWTEKAQPAASPVHLCFTAPTREAVDQFHALGLQLGCKGQRRAGNTPRAILRRVSNRFRRQQCGSRGLLSHG